MILLGFGIVIWCHGRCSFGLIFYVWLCIYINAIYILLKRVSFVITPICFNLISFLSAVAVSSKFFILVSCTLKYVCRMSIFIILSHLLYDYTIRLFVFSMFSFLLQTLSYKFYLLINFFHFVQLHSTNFR